MKIICRFMTKTNALTLKNIVNNSVNYWWYRYKLPIVDTIDMITDLIKATNAKVIYIFTNTT